MKYPGTILTYLISLVWLLNGLFCKVAGLVPRHQLIVARILGDEHSKTLTILIGLMETGMALWIASGIKRQLNAVIQITTIAVMNSLEYFLAPDLLLWGKWNAMFAFFFILIIGYTSLYTDKKIIQQG